MISGTAPDIKKLGVFYFLIALFIGLNAWFAVHDILWFTAVPVALFLLFYLFFSLDKVLWFVVMATPLAINTRIPDFGLAISLPTEPLLISILMVFILKIFHQGALDRDFIRHPITIAILINLLWMTVTCFTSSLPLVSLKFIVSRLWFIVSFYYFGYYLFLKPENVRRFIWAYCIPFVAVIGYTIKMHSDFGFTVDTANWVMSPFYNDHTAYGAMLAFFIPALVALGFDSKQTLFIRAMGFMLLGVFLLAIVLSYSRAAWVSLGGAAVIFMLIRLKISFRVVAFSALGGLFFFLAFQDQIFQKLEKNRQDSSSDIGEHVKSISNISSDASNLERINRWQSAIRMFKARPFFGWGPGTYSFKYAPFQFSYEKTIISTNAGNRGNAHSEYIGPLAESGALGTITFLFIIAMIYYRGILLYHRIPEGRDKAMLLAVLLGLVTYFTHGILNNFLDTDKASVPFWAFLAIITALDVRYKKEEKKSVEPAA
jgi:O-antigen ligase